MMLLSSLATESGVSFAMPATQSEAHTIIGSYLSKRRTRKPGYDAQGFTYRKPRKF